MSRSFLASLFFLALILPLAGQERESQAGTLLLGLSSGSWLESSEGEEAEAALLLLPALQYAWRGRTPDAGYLLLEAGARARLLDMQPEADSEELRLVHRRMGEEGYWENRIGLASSFAQARLSPSLASRLEWGREVRPFAEAGLELEADLNGTDDNFSPSLRLGARWDRSLRLSLESGVTLAWQSWYETPLYRSDGAESSERRQDWLLAADLGLSGLAGYFLEWSLSLGGSLRFSNANRFLEAEGLEDDSESRWRLESGARLDWSPASRLSLYAAPYFLLEGYFERAALDEAGLSRGQRLLLTTLGGRAGLSLNLSPRTFLVLEADGESVLANDPGEESWLFSVSAGLQVLF